MTKRSLVWCTALVASAAFVGLLAWRPVSATTRAKGLLVEHPLPAVGLGATQLLQVNVANVSREHRDSSRTELNVQVRLLDTSGAELARSERKILPLGATFSWEVAATDLAGVSRDPHGRTLTRAVVDVGGTPRVGAFVPSLSLIDEITGQTSGMIGDIRTVISAEAGTARECCACAPVCGCGLC